MKAGRLFLITLLVCALAAGGTLTYKRWFGLKKAPQQELKSSSSQEQFFSIPPFSTREPDRYRATRIITSVDSNGEGVQAPATVTKILIAREGEKRREDYDSNTDFRTTFLEIPEGIFVLLPARKLYSDNNPASASPALPNQQSGLQNDSSADFSPGTLLNETTGARYERLGIEKLDGRTTTKYRVTGAVSTNGTDPPVVALIWIDETLGVPIRSETEDSAGSHRSKLTVELRDIQLQVDPKLFELPKDFKKVEDSQLRESLRQIRVAVIGGSPKP